MFTRSCVPDEFKATLEYTAAAKFCCRLKEAVRLRNASVEDLAVPNERGVVEEDHVDGTVSHSPGTKLRTAIASSLSENLRVAHLEKVTEEKR